MSATLSWCVLAFRLLLVWSTLALLGGVEAQCLTPPAPVANGTWTCTMAAELDSCQYTCAPGLQHRDGVDPSCMDGEWHYAIDDPPLCFQCPGPGPYAPGEGCNVMTGCQCTDCITTDATELPGSNRCYCNAGYYDSNPGTGVEDIECNDCGGYICSSGYYKSGVPCRRTDVNTQTCAVCAYGPSYTCPPWQERSGSFCSGGDSVDTQTCEDRIYCPQNCEQTCTETPGVAPYFQCGCHAPLYLNATNNRTCLGACNDYPPIALTPGYMLGNCTRISTEGAVCTLKCLSNGYTTVGATLFTLQCTGGEGTGTGVWLGPPAGHFCAANCDLAAFVASRDGFTSLHAVLFHGETEVLGCATGFRDLSGGATNFTVVCLDGVLHQTAPVGVCTSVCESSATADISGAATLKLLDNNCVANTLSGQTCFLACAPGFVGVGTFNYSCGFDHQWHGPHLTVPQPSDVGVCYAPCLTLPTALALGSGLYPLVNRSGCLARLPVAPQSQCVMDCVPVADGVPVVGRGSFALTCQAGGSWLPSVLAGECVAGGCAVPLLPANAAAGSCVGVLDNNVNCTVSCLSGYVLAANSSAGIQCVDGVWRHPVSHTLLARQTCVVAPGSAPSDGGSPSLPVAAIAAGVGGGGAVLLGLVVCCFVRQRRRVTSDVLKRAQSAQETELMSKTHVVSTDIQLDGVIGEGVSAVVYRAQWHGTEVAAKVPKAQDSEATQRAFHDEVAINVKLPFHPRVINFVGACMQAPHLTLLMRFMDCGSLEELFVVKKAFPVHAGVPNAELHRNLKIALQVAVDASAGLLHCHLNDLIHRDVRAANFLITVDNGEHRATISDFGISRFLAKGTTEGISARSEKLPMMWMAPEAIMKCTYSRSTDVYMFAMTLFELFARIVPYPDTTLARFVQQDEQQLAQSRPILPPHTPTEVIGLLKRIWYAASPAERPSMQHINQELSRMLADVIKANPAQVNVAQRFGIGATPESTSSTKREGGTYSPVPTYTEGAENRYDSYLRVAEVNHYAENTYVFSGSTTAK